jgi:hypothetical protein
MLDIGSAKLASIGQPPATDEKIVTSILEASAPGILMMRSKTEEHPHDATIRQREVAGLAAGWRSN